MDKWDHNYSLVSDGAFNMNKRNAPPVSPDNLQLLKKKIKKIRGSQAEDVGISKKFPERWRRTVVWLLGYESR